jgi:toxin ParE1/3/4
MTRRIIIRPRASVDIDEQFAYIAANNFDSESFISLHRLFL